MAGELVGGHHTSSVNPRITWEGCSVLLDINDGDRLVFARLSPAATLKIGDKKCSLRPLIGCPFGSLFRVETGPNGPHLERCVHSPSGANDMGVQEGGDRQLESESKDNRALIDNNSAQNLSSEDIDAMRRDGATGDEIVEALIANSSTYENKTVFSQEKYKRRKQKKYAPKVLLRRPFTRSICEAYFKKYPNRIGFLRIDTLSLLLSFANISAYSDVLLVDMVGGLLTGSVAERLGGTGYVCNTYFGGTSHSLDIARIFNFSSEFDSRIVQASYSHLCSVESLDEERSKMHEIDHPAGIQSIIGRESSTKCDPSTGSTQIQEVQSLRNDNSSLDEELGNTKENLSSGQEGLHENNATITYKAVNPGKQASPDAIKMWKEKGFNSLIVAAPELEVDSIVQKLVPLLSYSAPFAIYHQYLQPLATCMHKLQSSKMAIGLQISEPWLREYQVLPSRTHPQMQMSGFGGYILSGTKISNNSEDCNGNQ
ncbi:tRNA (adenine(58)-N(1))-methyltransferase non-catalytic subunit trm6 isoform X1 [Dioscorea cayenensis subsp. rotundata]|uniref:tRNA (adenine(58)-N(1))-methyltransferase non-catalytic subunit TRM6 n=2 Tax=Dioscorea cayennensis subsp. rotundata TaxID=55577 RepID=A0AB40BEN1_DIOCR|nr:tRNA (adenine(58)-N(1))-methyltransferase non-catalytic subunit trm6 isoform X1 [Dioscorea cayenensis subsp. rotundata]